MHKSKIEWVLNPDNKTLGYVWNPITGCLNGCEYCWAYKLANGRLKNRYLANHNMVPFENIEDEDGSDHWQFHDPFYPRFWRNKWLDLTWQSRRGIFVCSMSDLFGIGIPEQWTQEIMDYIQVYPRCRFYLLTKQPQNLPKWSPFPPNCYIGVSVTNQEMFDKAIHYLKMIDAKVKFLSFEPLLERINID